MLAFDIHSGSIYWNSKLISRLSKSEGLIFIEMLEKINEFNSKDDLLNQGWPDRVVSPNSLVVAIKNIRKALQVTNTSFNIETIHRKGYILHGDNSCFKIIKKAPAKDSNSVEKIAPNINLSKINTKNINSKFSTYEKKSVDDISTLNSSRFITKKITLHIILKAALLIYSIIIICLAIIFYSYSSDYYCYTYKLNNKVCGVFPLNNKNMKKIENMLSEENGEFLYGLVNHGQEIEVYRIK